jgi:hypothetical protein
MSNNSLVPSQDEMKAIEVIVKHAVESKYFDKIGGLAGAFSIVMYAREMGLPVMSSLFGGIRPVLGKVEIAPQIMNGMIRKAGHLILVKKHTNEICTIYAKRKDTGEEMTVSFTIEDAKRAKIYKPGGAWECYPKNMVFVRALANLARWQFPDIIGMAYIEGELEDEEIKAQAENEKPEDIKITDINAKAVSTEPTEEESFIIIKEKFKSIENMDYDLKDFVIYTSEKAERTVQETVKSALKQEEKFNKAYLKWVEDKSDRDVAALKATQEILV